MIRSDGCTCRLCADDDRSGWGEPDLRMATDIDTFGWHVVSVSGTPQWAYTIGLLHSFGLPELIIFGLRSEVHRFVLNGIAEALRDKELPGDEVPVGIGSGNLPFRMGALDDGWKYWFPTFATWMYRSNEIPIRQVVWTDKEGRFPSDPEFDESCEPQPDGARPPTFPPTDRWSCINVAQGWPTPAQRGGLVFVSTSVQQRRKPVRYVARYDDGDWFFGDLETRPTPENVVLLHVEYLLEHDPSIVETIDLAPWREAERQEPAMDWIRSVTPPDPE